MFNISKWFRRHRTYSPPKTVVARAEISMALNNSAGVKERTVNLSARFYIEGGTRKISYSTDYKYHDPSKITQRIDHVAKDWLEFGTSLPNQITFPDTSYVTDIEKLPVSEAECGCMSRWKDYDDERVATVAKVHGNLPHIVSLPSDRIGGIILSDDVRRWLVANVGEGDWRYIGVTLDSMAWLSFSEAAAATVFKLKFG
jgi:hypothetical protein